jgi:putative ABC transport system substrate-binding protein
LILVEELLLQITSAVEVGAPAAKRLELLKEAAPRVSHVGFLANLDHADNELSVAKRAASAHGIRLHSMNVRGSGDVDGAFNTAIQAGVDAIYAVSSRNTSPSGQGRLVGER